LLSLELTSFKTWYNYGVYIIIITPSFFGALRECKFRFKEGEQKLHVFEASKETSVTGIMMIPTSVIKVTHIDTTSKSFTLENTVIGTENLKLHKFSCRIRFCIL